MYTPSPETQALYAALEGLAPGEFVSWERLSGTVGFNTLAYVKRVRYVRAQMCVNGRAVVSEVKGGLRRLTDAEVVHLYAPGQKRRVSRAALRGITGLGSVDYDALQPAERVAHNAHASALGVIRLCTKRETHKAFEEGVKAAGVTLPPTDALKLFQK